ncbi:MAG: response regulator transcription factor [Gemmataceae bacterium]|nr:response regulator transcription factor [Gemmataceae bacterium]
MPLVAKLRILLADDHAVVREGLKVLVNAQGDMQVIGEAADGRTAVQKAMELRPNVVVMDMSMPELNGARATEQLKDACPHIKVLALSVHEDRSYWQQFLEAGASGYVLKRAAAADLIQAIRTVAAGGVYLDPEVAGKVVGSIIRQPSLNNLLPGTGLSEREAEVVHLIAQGYSNKEIAAKLALSVKTVETYKTRALEKLGLHGRAEVVRYALQRGWLQAD